MESGGRGRARARYLSWRWPWVGTGKKRAGKCRMGPRVGAPGQDSEYGASWAQDGEGGLRTPPASGERSMAASRHCKSARLGPGRARRDREEVPRALDTGRAQRGSTGVNMSLILG